jgi:heme-degrading monooxygenase HmoA
MSTKSYSDEQIEQLAKSHGISVEEMKKYIIDSHSDVHGEDVFVLVELYYPIEGKTEDVLKIAQESSALIVENDGLIQTMVLKPIDKDGPVSNISIWKSKDDFNVFMKSEAFKSLYSSDMIKNIKSWTSDINVMKFDFMDGWHSMHY